MKHFLYFIICSLLGFYACSPPTNTNLDSQSIIQLTEGLWRGVLDIGNDTNPLELPFNFEVVSNKKIVIHNGDEHIEVTDINYDEKDNSFSIKMPVFGSEFKLVNHQNRWEGEWHNYNKKDYKIPFKAVNNNPVRFQGVSASGTTSQFKKRWKVTFSPDTEDSYPAIGLFNVLDDGTVTGTFLTQTGDYRYLEGGLNGKELNLSCFDGAHAFLFKATIQEDGSLKGDFWSGKHWHEPWVATPDESFELLPMDKLTYLKKGYDKLAFRFPTINGDTLSLEDARFQGKPTIVQITGSWCPNCMDETRFLVDVYKEYKSKGLEIIAIDYEVVNDFEIFQKNASRIKDHLKIDYPVVFGGPAKKSEAVKTLPMLNHIMSYPTAIFIDKNGKIREIHTGFSGPGTGDLYQEYVDKTITLVEQMIAE
jgi:thiol-disulfide isomerase/thioredoxin